MKQDIQHRADIELLVDTFYDKVQKSAIIGFIFNDIAKVNWETHLPKMYSFWASLLLGEYSFKGNPMQQHIALSKLAPLTSTEFDEWLRLFTETVDSLFVGEKADEAKLRAENIAKLLLHKIEHS